MTLRPCKIINPFGGESAQYTTMPTASASNVGDIVQYVGETTSSYTKGYFYQCSAQGTSPETYAWEQKDVQPGGTTGSANTDLSNLTSSGESHFAKPTATGTITSGGSQTLADNTVYTGSSITSITLAYPTSPASTFISEVQMGTGTGTITFAIDSGTTMKGADCSDGTFTPLASKTYSILFGISGTSKYGIVISL